MRDISIEEIDAELARRSLRVFIKEAFEVIEPETSYSHNWHIDAIADHLEAVSRGEIKKLIINVPPGHMKSLCVCVFWPSWEWLHNPHLRWIFASYGSHLSIRDSVKMRSLIMSEWYQKHFRHIYQIKKSTEKLISNDKGGFRVASSVGGVGTGERVHRVVNDDLVRANDSHSSLMKEQAIKHMQAMSTRAVDSTNFAQVLIMQRLTEDDPTGWAKSKWKACEELIIPGEFDPKRKFCTTIGWEDPRKTEGELLWSEKFSDSVMNELKEELGEYGYASQIQQLPAPPEGGIIKNNWWKFYTEKPRFKFILQSWDTAFKDGAENDFSVCTTWGISEEGYFLIDRYKDKPQFPELVRMVKMQANAHSPNQIVIEDKASGQSLLQSLKKETLLPIKAVKVDRDKIARCYAVSPKIQAGFVFLPENSEWTADYLYNMGVFPDGAHDDDVDSTTQALSELILYKKRPIQQFSGSIMGR